MKPQDIIFIFCYILLVFISRKNSNFLVISGLFFILVAVPLYYLQIFFTAERLIIYSLILIATNIIVGFLPRK